MGIHTTLHPKGPTPPTGSAHIAPNKDNKCRASVVQRNGNFTIGSQQHNHNAESDKAAKIKIVAAIKKKALEEKFMPASKIVNEVNQSESTLFTLFLCMEVSELYVGDL